MSQEHWDQVTPKVEHLMTGRCSECNHRPENHSAKYDNGILSLAYCLIENCPCTKWKKKLNGT